MEDRRKGKKWRRTEKEKIEKVKMMENGGEHEEQKNKKVKTIENKGKYEEQRSVREA